MVSSLETNINRRFDALEIRLDDQAARLDRRGGLIPTSQVWIFRHSDWVEHVDQAIEAKDKQIADLMRTIERLEAGPSQAA